MILECWITTPVAFFTSVPPEFALFVPALGCVLHPFKACASFKIFQNTRLRCESSIWMKLRVTWGGHILPRLCRPDGFLRLCHFLPRGVKANVYSMCVCVCESWVLSQSIQVLIIIFVDKIFFLEYFLNLLISGPKSSKLSSTIKVACREIYEQLRVNICTQSHLPFKLHFTWQLWYDPCYVNQGVLLISYQTLYSKIKV